MSEMAKETERIKCSFAYLRQLLRFGSTNRQLEEIVLQHSIKAEASPNWGSVGELAKLNQRLEELTEGLKGGRNAD